MNYIKLINQFWKLRRSKRVTSLQADLYYFLIQECNERDWENPFECSNRLICVSIGISEPTMIDARNRLKQLGLIDFKGGKRNEASPVYTLCYLNNLSRNREESIVNTEEEVKLNVPPIIETKPNETKSRERKKEKKEIIKNPFSENFLPEWEKWKNYKKEEWKFSFKSADSEQAAISELFSISEGDEAIAVKIIRKSIGHGWKGLFKLKREDYATHQPSNYKPGSKSAGANELLNRLRSEIGLNPG